MPAGSEVEAPALPVRFRPLGVRLAALLFGVALVATIVAVWLTMPQATRDAFTFLQRLTVVLMCAGLFVVAHAMARCRVDADTDGVRVVNGYRTYDLSWGEIVAVTLRPGNPWAVLDLSDGTSRSALGIQGSDGARAQRQVRQLRALVDARAGTEPTRPQKRDDAAGPDAGEDPER